MKVSGAIRRGASETWRERRLALLLWGVTALAGLLAAMPWAGAWSEALHETGAGHELARGFDLMLLSDLIRSAGPSLGALRGWAWGSGIGFVILIAVLQGGALQMLLARPEQRTTRLFGKGCGAHARAMLRFAVLALAGAGLCAGIVCASRRAAHWIELDAVGTWSAPALRCGGGVAALALFAALQVILELARLVRVRRSAAEPGAREAGIRESLAAAWRLAFRRPLPCLLIYAAATAGSFAALIVAGGLARAAGALPSAWAVGIWGAAQLWILARWACRIGMWASFAALLEDAA
jgi:hypothetical protein